MKFRELLEGVEDWFWKLEYVPAEEYFELYLGIPNDWVYGDGNEIVVIETLHKMEENSIIKITAQDIDDVLNMAKLLVAKNKELETRKEAHREEMERLKNVLIEKEMKFLEYMDTVKDIKSEGANEGATEGASEGTTEGVNDGVSDGANDGVKAESFISDLNGK